MLQRCGIRVCTGQSPSVRKPPERSVRPGREAPRPGRGQRIRPRRPDPMTEPILAARPASAQLSGLAPAELRGPCSANPELFFTEDDPAAAAAAKAICGGCPFRAPCLAFALATRQPYGVWGGLTAEERRPAVRRICPRCGAECPPRRI